MRGLFVVADDRTGALEVAGACADATGAPVVVETSLRHDDGAPRIRVVDLGTRHLAAREAADRAGAVGTFDAAAADSPVVHAHKIDSTLRGNWAAELVARHVATGRRVLVVPAFPLVGRQCIGGVVVANGVPVAEGAAGVDARGAVASSRPAELLRAAGASSVVELRRGAPLDGWLRRTSAASAAFAVCDAGDDSDLHAIAAAWTDAAVDVLFAGTAGSIGAAAAALAGPRGPRGPTPMVLPLPALVVCGSLHPVARQQLASLAAAGASERVLGRELPAGSGERVLVLRSRVPAELPVPDAAARAVADELADAARSALVTGRWRTVVVIGGDTAAAVLGDAPVAVGGTVAPGMPWFRLTSADGPIVVTKAGGFGAADALRDLLLERTT